jgi:hypothetical protein
MNILSKTALNSILALGALTAFSLADSPARAASHDGAPMMMQGGDASRGETGDIHSLFANNEAIRRTVTNRPDGIRTVTESDDPEVAATIKRHVDDMMKRVAEKRDPGLAIESPALRAIFENYDKIATSIEQTEKGVIVTQTSADATTVALLQKHAGEVTAFVDNGMDAVHTAMMQNMGGRGPGSMGGEMGMGRSGMMQGGAMGTMRTQMMQNMRRMTGPDDRRRGADDHSNH